jgi:hypothetical protein
LTIIPSDKLTWHSRYSASRLHIDDEATWLTRCSGILYASTSLSDEVGFQLLKKAVDALLSTVDVTPTPTVMWCMQYQQHTNSSTGSAKTPSTGHVLKMSPPSLHLAFEDATLDRVRELWEKIMGDEADEFLVFEDRDANVDDDE